MIVKDSGKADYVIEDSVVTKRDEKLGLARVTAHKSLRERRERL